MQCARDLLHPGMLKTFFEDAQPFVERHSGLKEMRQLLREHEQLAMWDL